MKDVLHIGIPVDLGDGSKPIVMVDDEQLDFEIARRFHQRSGIANPFVHYLDGMSFIEDLGSVKRGEAPLPALVLMDINMPRMTGFEVVKRLRQDDMFRQIPIVSMLTSSTDPIDRERAAAIGADSYLVKPYDPRAYLDFFTALAA